MLKALAIESSCDETSVAIVTSEKQVLSNIILSQYAEHKPYGGVVPEIAARAHLNYLPKLVEDSLNEAALKYEDIDLIAVTGGPGLIGGVIVGVMFAKALAYSLNKPFIAINHLEGHALTVRLTSDIKYPFLLLLVSGGHTQFISVKSLGEYALIGSTIDDAIGEAFDKVAKMLNLGYPGGPIIEELAKSGNPLKFNFPKSLIHRAGCDFSFSGLKTAISREIIKHEDIDLIKADIAASFQYTVATIIKNRLTNAIKEYRKYSNNNSLVMAGGVAANMYLREQIKLVTDKYGFHIYAPPINLCTDNAAMIGWAAIERFNAGYRSNFNYTPLSRWPLNEASNYFDQI